MNAAQNALVCGDLRTAREHFAAAHAEALDDIDPVRRAQAALGMGGLWLAEQREDDVAAGVRARQVSALDELDPQAHRTLWLRLAVRRAAEDSYLDGEQAELSELLGEVRKNGDPTALAEALSLVLHARLGPEFAADRIELAEEMRAAASLTSSSHWTLMADCWVAVAHSMAGHIEAPRSRRLLAHRCAQSGSMAITFVSRAIAVADMISAGRFAEAELEAHDVVKVGMAAGDVDARTYFFAHLAAIRFLQGRGSELAELALDAASSIAVPRFDLAMLHVAAMFAIEAGDPAAAHRAVAAHRSSAGRNRYQSSTFLLAMTALATVARETGDSSLGAEVARALAPFRGLPVVASLGVAHFGPVERAIGVALHAALDLEAADASLAAAIETLRIDGSMPMAAVAMIDRARVLIDAGSTDEANCLVREACEIAERFAMTGWSQRWSSMLVVAESAALRPFVTLARNGPGLWTARLGRHECVVPESRGLAYLAALCANPGHDVPATQLAYGTSRRESQQPLTDRPALAALRTRRDEVRRELDATFHDEHRRRRLEDELDVIVANVGLGRLAGRSSPFVLRCERTGSHRSPQGDRPGHRPTRSALP